MLVIIGNANNQNDAAKFPKKVYLFDRESSIN